MAACHHDAQLDSTQVSSMSQKDETKCSQQATAKEDNTQSQTTSPIYCSSMNVDSFNQSFVPEERSTVRWMKGSVKTVLHKQQTRKGDQTDSQRLRNGLFFGRHIPDMKCTKRRNGQAEVEKDKKHEDTNKNVDPKPRQQRGPSVLGLARLRPSPLPEHTVSSKQTVLMVGAYYTLIGLILVAYCVWWMARA